MAARSARTRSSSRRRSTRADAAKGLSRTASRAACIFAKRPPRPARSRRQNARPDAGHPPDRPGGPLVSKVLVTEAVDIARELYFAILLDRASGAPSSIASTEGGMDIEAVAEHTPEKIFREPVHPLLGLQAFQTRKLAQALGLSGAQLAAAAKLFSALFRLFVACDCSLVEINPLVVTPKGEVLALDAKFNFDDNALYRQPEIVAMRDKRRRTRAKSPPARFAQLHRPRRKHRLPRQRRRPRHGDDGHHPVLRRQARRTSSMSAAAQAESRSPRHSRSSSATRT